MADFASDDEAAGYLAAMIDGEGCVTWRAPTSGGTKVARRVEIYNTDTEIIAAVLAACERLGIGAHAIERHHDNPRWKRSYIVTIGRRRGLERLASMVRLRAPGKREKLEQAVESYRLTMSRPEDRPLDEIRRLYYDEGLSTYEIGRRFKRGPVTIHSWMKAAGMLLRTRSEAGLLRAEGRIDRAAFEAAYVERKMNVPALAREFDICAPTASRLLDLYGIPRRTHGEAISIGRRRGDRVKLNPDKVREIRALRETGLSQQELACRFGVGKRAIVKVLHGETWKDVA